MVTHPSTNQSYFVDVTNNATTMPNCQLNLSAIAITVPHQIIQKSCKTIVCVCVYQIILGRADVMCFLSIKQSFLF